MSRAVVFIVGAPRSGTTLLQNLLGSHPLVATSQETDLFTHYLAPLRARWEYQLPSDPEAWARWRHKGLPAVLTEHEFDAIVADMIERVHSRTLDLKPGANVCLVKVPQDCEHAELILRYLPHARFIHIIRDGRDVVASMLRANRTWGGAWAPKDVFSAADQWRVGVEAGRSIQELTDAYLEVRYEELVSTTAPALLRHAFAFAGIQAGDDECSRTCAEFSLQNGGATRSSLVWGGEVIRRLRTAPSEPRGFAGAGGVGAWEKELDLWARGAFERQSGRLLHELGYASSSQWVQPRRPARAAASCRANLGWLSLAVRYHLAVRVSRSLR